MDTGFADLPDAVWLRRVLPRAHIAYRSNNRDVQAVACRAGAGLAVLPCLLGDATRDLHRIDIGEQPPGRDVWIGYHRDLKQLARLRALLDATIQALGS
jgi:DNA-binding transcriptional LysR family regulator